MPVTVVVGAQWGDEGKAKVIDLLAKEHTLRRALPGRPQRRAHRGRRRRAVRAAADPQRHPVRPRHPGDRQRRRGRPADAVQRDGHASRRRGVVVRPAAGVQPRPPDLPVAPGPRRVGRGDARRRQDRHDAEGHRPRLRRQGPPRRRARRRRARSRRVRRRTSRPAPSPRTPSSCDAGGEPLDVDEIVERFATLGARLAPYVVDTVSLLHDALDRASTCCWRAPRRRSSTSTTAPIRTSRRRTPPPAAPAPAPGSGPRDIDRVVGITKAYTTRVGAGPFPTELLDATATAGRHRPRVRHRHRSAPPRRLAGLRDAPPGRAPQLADRGGADQARRARRVRDGQGVHRLPRRRPAAAALPRPVDVLAGSSPSTTSSPDGAPTLGASASRATCRRRRAAMRRARRAEVGVPVSVVGVGAERDDYRALERDRDRPLLAAGDGGGVHRHDPLRPLARGRAAGHRGPRRARRGARRRRRCRAGTGAGRRRRVRRRGRRARAR